ncbi:MAG: hypothetical protein HYX85_00265 [Chloroflexi bacterium]|nr:hypothetical protein [Chloroflexota bacterium]
MEKKGMKVVMTFREDGAMAGISAPDCDPVFRNIGGGLPEMLASLPTLIAEAEAKWQANPRNPKSDFKPPEPVPTRQDQQTAVRPASKPAEKPQDTQQALF